MPHHTIRSYAFGLLHLALIAINEEKPCNELQSTLYAPEYHDHVLVLCCVSTPLYELFGVNRMK